MKMLEEERKGLVVISFSDKYFSSNEYSMKTRGGNETNLSGRKLRIYSKSLAQTFKKIESLGHRVVFINPVPHFTGTYDWNLRTCLLSDLLHGCEKSMPLNHSQTIQQDFKDVTRRVTLSLGIQNIDLANVICSRRLCSNSKNGEWIYSDSTHLTNSFSRHLSKLIEEKIY
jgi:hypothetical protein